MRVFHISLSIDFHYSISENYFKTDYLTIDLIYNHYKFIDRSINHRKEILRFLVEFFFLVFLNRTVYCVMSTLNMRFILYLNVNSKLQLQFNDFKWFFNGEMTVATG